MAAATLLHFEPFACDAPCCVWRAPNSPGFGARRRSGLPSYFLQTRIGARLTWITIGRHGNPWTPETARKEAYRLLGQIAGGDEPRLKRQDLSDQPTLGQVALRFMAEYGVTLKPTSVDKYKFLIDRYIVPELGDRLVARIARPDVMKLHTGIARTKSLANYAVAVAVLSKIMSWAEEQNLRTTQSNPCFRIKKFREGKRPNQVASRRISRAW